MTREETKKCIEVMKHFEDGGEVQILVYDYGGRQEWEDFPNPDWNWDYHTYRIKPQLMKVTEEEMKEMQGIWVKLKDSDGIAFVKPWTINKENYYILNSETMEWEDWDANADSRHHYNGDQP